MKRILFGAAGISILLIGTSVSSANAADLLLKAPPPPPVFSWTGFYLGANGGGGFGQREQFNSFETYLGAPFVDGTWPGGGNFGTLRPSGGFGGGQLGYNWQTGPFVLGIEGDLQGASIRGSQSATLPYISGANTVTEWLNTNLEIFGTVRGRIGYAWDNLMLFATGGFAYGETHAGYMFADSMGFAGGSDNYSTRIGYAVGGGFEYAFLPKLSLKVEYQYIDLGSTTVGLAETLAGAATGYGDFASASFRYNIVRLGLNYHL